MSEYCPRCGGQRIGSFRYCRSCQFDFDDTQTALGTGPPKVAPPGPGPFNAAAGPTRVKAPPAAPGTAPGWTKPAGTPLRGRWIIGALVVVAVLIAIGTTRNGGTAVPTQRPGTVPAVSRAPAATVSRTAAATRWWPSDYSLVPSDPTVAFRWMKSSEFDCTFSTGKCWAIEAIARDGCPSSLYIELSILDTSGRNWLHK